MIQLPERIDELGCRRRSDQPLAKWVYLSTGLASVVGFAILGMLVWSIFEDVRVGAREFRLTNALILLAMLAVGRTMNLPGSGGGPDP